MKYHYKKSDIFSKVYGEIYYCNHPIYRSCTLFKIGSKGLAVIQQRFQESAKRTWWGPIDDFLLSEIYLHPRFREFFDKYSGYCTDELYPTVTVRQIMWGLRMKPLPRERWETYFDRKPI